MAIATENSGRHLSAEASAAAWSAGIDRSRAFARARRHSMVVRWLRIALPICTLAVLSSYGLFVQRSIGIGEGTLQLGPVALSSEYLTMHNPRYEGYSKDGSHFTVSARTAEQDIGQKEPIKLNTIEGRIVQPNNSVTTLQATRGVFDSKANELELFDSIEIKSGDGMAARLSSAKVYVKESKIISDAPVTVEMTTGALTGNKMVLLQKTSEVMFTDGVTARLKPRKPGGAAADSPEAKQSNASLIGSGDGPVEVTAPMLTVNDERKTAIFSGNVRVEQDGSVLTARELEVVYEGDSGGQQEAAAGVPGAAAGRVKQILARDDVVMTRGTDRVLSAAAVFNTVEETSVLTGGVTFTSGQDRSAVADRADLDFRAETATLTGAVTVSQGPNTLKGRRLFVDRKNGVMQLAAPGENGSPSGRIETRFQQPEARPSRGPSSPDGEAGGWRFQTDPTAPIEIEANLLDVDDKSRTATFRGDVHVVQGDFSIRTVELIANYSGQAGISLMQPSQDTNAKAPAAQLQRVQARKKVVVTSSKDDQSATGDWADFDVKANKVVLGGDVTLTQGRNVVRGPRLVIDMATGLSRMETTKPANATADSAPQDKAPNAKGWPAGACGGRMCAVFYPKDVEALAQRGKAAISPGSRENKGGQQNQAARRQGEPASGWSSTTTPAE